MSSLAAALRVSWERGLVIQKQQHQVNNLIFSIKIKKHSPSWPAGQHWTSKRRLLLIVFVLKYKISKEFVACFPVHVYAPTCSPAISAQRWPHRLGPPSISPWYAIYTSAPSSSPALPLPPPWASAAHIWHSQFKVGACTHSIKNNLIKSVYAAPAITLPHLLPPALGCVFTASQLKATLLYEITFWKSLEKPFEYANSG